MKTKIEELEPCKLKVSCQANAIEIMDAKAKVLETFKKAPVPGNRNGKASMDAIKMHYRDQIDESTKRALAEECYHEALFQHKLQVYGTPQFISLLLDGGKFSTDFLIHTKPDFELPDWKTMEIPKPHQEQTIEEVAALIMQDLRVKLGDADPYGQDDFAQANDNVIVSYEATMDGAKLDNLCVENEMMTIGKSQLQGFDSNLLGMSMGETREFDFIAPEGGLPSLSGKTVHFKVSLITGSKAVPCALNDEMAQKIGKNTFQELQEAVSQSAFAQVENNNRAKLQAAISKRLVAESQIAVPNWMSLSEAQYLAQQSHIKWETMIDGDRERFVQMAEQNVKLSLILDKIRESTPEAQLSDQEVFEIIKQNIAKTKVQQSLDEVIQQMQKTGQLAILFSRIKDEHTMNVLVKQVKVIE